MWVKHNRLRTPEHTILLRFLLSEIGGHYGVIAVGDAVNVMPLPWFALR
jgi:hypothetical protein